MAKGLVRILIFFIFFIPLVGGICYFVWLALQLDNYKGVIARVIYQQTGRQLTINGHLTLAPSWNPTVTATNITFSNAGWSKTPTAATIKKATIQFDLKALLHQQLKIEHMSAQNAQFLFERNTKHESNWQFNILPDNDATLVSFSRPFDLSLTNVTILIRHPDKTTENIKFANANIALYGPAKTLHIIAQGIANHSAFNTDTTIVYPDDRVKGRYQIKMTLDARQDHLELHGDFTRGPTRQDNLQLAISGKDFSDIIGLFGTPYLKSGNFTIKSALRIDGKHLQFKNIMANILGGKITGNLDLDLNGNLPVYKFDLVGRGLNAGQTLHSTEVNDQFENGSMYIHYEINTLGFTEQSLLGNQTGTITVGINNVYHPSNTLRIYTQKLFQLLSGGLSNQGVTLNCLVTRLSCNTGVCVIKGFAFNTPGANVVGKGSINLGNNTLNVLIIPVSKIVNLNPLAIPMYITGNMKNPMITPAADILTRQLLGNVLAVITGEAVIRFLSGGFTPDVSNDQNVQSCLNTLKNFEKERNSLTQKILSIFSVFTAPFTSKTPAESTVPHCDNCIEPAINENK